MNSNNLEITYRNRVDYKEVLYTKREIPDLPTEQIINDACLVLDNCSAKNIVKCSLYISAFRTELRGRTDVQSEGLDKLSCSLSNCLNALRSSNKIKEAFVITRLDEWMKEKLVTILDQGVVEHVEHYNASSSSNDSNVVNSENNIDSEEYTGSFNGNEYSSDSSNAANASNLRIVSGDESNLDAFTVIEEIPNLQQPEASRNTANASSFSNDSNVIASENGTEGEESINNDFNHNKYAVANINLNPSSSDINITVLAAEHNTICYRLMQALKARDQNLNDNLKDSFADDGSNDSESSYSSDQAMLSAIADDFPSHKSDRDIGNSEISYQSTSAIELDESSSTNHAVLGDVFPCCD